MMFNYVCDKDRVVFRVPKTDPNVSILPVLLKCPRCEEHITVSATWKKGCEILILSAEDFFRAANGLGLPDKEDASEARVQYLLREGQITLVVTKEASESRVLIERIHVKTPEDRRYILHFASSTKGATIFKVTEIDADPNT